MTQQDTQPPAETLATVRKALQPFADYADPRKKMPATVPITSGSAMAKRQITMGDCYAARDALAALLALLDPAAH